MAPVSAALMAKGRSRQHRTNRYENDTPPQSWQEARLGPGHQRWELMVFRFFGNVGNPLPLYRTYPSVHLP